MKFAIIGGDLRIIKLAEMLAKDAHEVYTYGLEKAKELKDIQNKDNTTKIRGQTI